MSEDPASPDVTAGELALGLLEGKGRADALRRVLADPAFAAEVERWRDHLSQLFDLWPEAVPPTDMLARIEQSLDGDVATVSSRRGWVWPALAGVMTVAAGVLLMLLLLPRTSVPSAQPTVAASQRPILVAAVTPSEKGTSVSAVYDPSTGSLRLSAATVPAGRSAELWVIADDGVPRALGLLRADAKTVLPIAEGNRRYFMTGAKLAISIEPQGGSKTGAPTGPVIASGVLTGV